MKTKCGALDSCTVCRQRLQCDEKNSEVAESNVAMETLDTDAAEVFFRRPMPLLTQCIPGSSSHFKNRFTLMR